jgi:hypothetical protein
MTELGPGDKPISEEFPEFTIEPVEPLGWNATVVWNGGRSSYTVAAPTITELRYKLRRARSSGRHPDLGAG